MPQLLRTCLADVICMPCTALTQYVVAANANLGSKWCRWCRSPCVRWVKGWSSWRKSTSRRSWRTKGASPGSSTCEIRSTGTRSRDWGSAASSTTEVRGRLNPTTSEKTNPTHDTRIDQSHPWLRTKWHHPRFEENCLKTDLHKLCSTRRFEDKLVLEFRVGYVLQYPRFWALTTWKYSGIISAVGLHRIDLIPEWDKFCSSKRVKQNWLENRVG